MFDAFTLPFFQRGVWEILLLSVGAGLIGTWIVLRGLAFYAHSVGTATFPGLVLADGLGFAAVLGAAGTGLLVALGVGALARRAGDRDRYDALTAIVLVGALSTGVILASDVFASAARVESLLFGSLLVIDSGDLVFAAAASTVVLLATVVLGTRWLVVGFDAQTARTLGARSILPDVVLLGLVALVAVSVLSAVGALLATALIVVPAAATRLLCNRMLVWQITTVVVVAFVGVGGLWLSVETNAPPGATIAVLSGCVFLLAVLVRELRSRGRARTGRAAATTVAAAALTLGAVGCGGGTTGASGDTLRVVATSTQVADFARAVGGEKVEVIQLLQPNSDPHDYEPRPADLRGAADADLMLVSGDGLDDWADDVAKQVGLASELVDVGAERPVKLEGAEHDEHAGDDEHADVDPHWWHDPRNAAAAVSAIRAAFARADAASAATFAANADSYTAELRQLERETVACLKRVPARQRLLVSDHDAFGYFTNRYGITFVGAIIPSTSTQAQVSAGELSRLARTVEKRDVQAIFPESALNPRLARTIADRTGAKVGGALYSDTLGPTGSAGATYLESERANARTLVDGFTDGKVTCNAPG